MLDARPTAQTSSDEIADAPLSVILVDIDLGGESGFELARRLDQDAGLAPGGTILISTHHPDDFAELIAASPAVGFLPKSELSAGAILDLVSGTRGGGHAAGT